MYGEVGKGWQWDEEDLRKLFTGIVTSLSQSHRIRIFVDALDEAGKETAQELVDFFHDLTYQFDNSEPALSICFSCRRVPIIRWKGGTICDVEKQNREAIKAYVHARLEAVAPDDLEDARVLENDIINRDSGIFQWIVLVVAIVLERLDGGESLPIIQEELHKVPNELKALYESMIRDINETTRAETLQLMQWVCLAERPLSLTELRYAFAFDTDPPHRSHRDCETSRRYIKSDEKMEKRVKELSRGLLQVRQVGDQRLVESIHGSVNDFYLETGLQLFDPLAAENAIGNGHHRLRRTCVKYITMEELCQLMRSSVTGGHEHLDFPLAYKEVDRQFPFLRYSTTSWLFHARKAEAEHISQRDILCQFQWPSTQGFRGWIAIYRRIDMFSDYCPNLMATLLHIVAGSGILSVAKALLQSEKGADVEAEDSGGRTALLWASRNGHEAVVRLLLEQGADVEAKDSGGQTALLWASRNGHEAVIRLLLEQGADVEAKDSDGRTALLWASMNEHEAVVRLLLEQGADVETKDSDGWTALLWASMNGHEAVVQLLRETK
jgi:hypothetical protein